jgi:hypothetical protein
VSLAKLWSAILNPRGPNYETWKRVLGSESVPLQSAIPVKAELGEEKDVEVYLLNLQAMTLKQRAHLLGYVSRKFGLLVSDLEKEIAENGFPIRAADVIVSISMRALV